MPKTSRGTYDKVKTLMGCLDQITTNAGRLDEISVTELLRRASIPTTPDGYPRSTALDSGGGSKDKWASTSVEGAVLARTERPPLVERCRACHGKGHRVIPSRSDPVRAQANRVEALIKDSAHNMREVVTALAYIGMKVEEDKERQAHSSACEICKTLPAGSTGIRAIGPAEKTGYCTLHYNDWWRHGKPDRARWKMYRCSLKNSEGLLLVDDFPPPSPGCKAIRGPWAK